MNTILLQRSHLGIPLPHQLNILINLIRLDLVKHNRMDIFPTRQHLRERPLNILIVLLALSSSVDEARNRTASRSAHFSFPLLA